ncbi:MAG: hypothetical protein QME58_09800 [Bacteroidota bacterium]|nr:hypothetical protein [Bacteroidota bacterium]
MNIKFVIFTLILIITANMLGQGKLSLLEIEKMKEYLSLYDSQFTVFIANIDKIKGILEEDKAIISNLKTRFKNGDEPGFFEKIKVKLARDSRAGKIDDLLDDIEDQLNDEQKTKYKNIEKPVLKSLSKKELTE